MQTGKKLGRQEILHGNAKVRAGRNEKLKVVANTGKILQKYHWVVGGVNRVMVPDSMARTTFSLSCRTNWFSVQRRRLPRNTTDFLRKLQLNCFPMAKISDWGATSLSGLMWTICLCFREHLASCVAKICLILSPRARRTSFTILWRTKTTPSSIGFF